MYDGDKQDIHQIDFDLQLWRNLLLHVFTKTWFGFSSYPLFYEILPTI